MSRRRFGEHLFELIGAVEPDRSWSSFLEVMPQSRFRDAAVARLHAYGEGPFCRFKIARKRREAGLYVLTRNGDPVYAGECANLEARCGPNGYGGISPRNCFQGGQPTNCRINAAILTSVKDGQQIGLWFHQFEGDTEQRRNAETVLILQLKPIWNKAKLLTGPGSHQRFRIR